MFKYNHTSRILVFLVVAFLLPLPFVATYLMGIEAGKVGVIYGIVAYVWLLLQMYVSTQPNWINRLVGLTFATGMSQILSLVALLFAGFHKQLSPAFGLVEQTGDVALMVLLSAGLYWVLLAANGLSSVLPAWANLVEGLGTGFGKRLARFLQGLMALTSGLVFIHSLLIDSVRSNLAFMAVFVPVSLFVFATYAYSRRTAPVSEAAEETKATLAEHI